LDSAVLLANSGVVEVGTHVIYKATHFFMFPEVKSALKGRFQNTEDIEKNITIE
jgi:hypothetical protein